MVDATPLARPMLGASGDLCPVCSGPTRHTPDVLDELAAAVIETGGSSRKTWHNSGRQPPSCDGASASGMKSQPMPPNGLP
jgi:hypothetical protein